ncbi:Uncharacterized protein ALO43_03375 [Pseudomonas tremae]|uniref:Uncharacterized protein n=1 Tax=Pseudomonas tremae TaxID=200454 RepID=A0AA40NZK9_9PSED|nr:hypothetical protein [Pseudomonas tremae]RMO02811.1 hypothetical protein ALQ48_03961 [Pseudomonas coronafaciens pv. zizaniae]RMP26602.1 hypothetical protein ALQ25_02959 [Pseudomonas coronafaciens pv. atropurpurea]KPY92044.1 Uncharacterized protein ALO43_03375 [Pseudomonas tremae]MCF5747988.1 hypothetical protein [Pseudomonas tremae]UQB34892.1 hypothetical protein I9H09_15000 [Pseudomonas tremae]
MNIDYAEDWAFLPHGGADAQYAHLISEENRLLRDEVDRYRRHVTKLINMHNDAALERDKLRVKLRDAESRISDLLRDACDSWKTINSQKYAIDQYREVMRVAGIGPERWGGQDR